MQLQSGQRFSHYEIIDQVGAGGMGVVYKARDLRLKRTVALKLLLRPPQESPDMVPRFLREAESAAALNHPCLAHVYEANEEDGVPFLAMEFLSGGSVRQQMTQARPPLERVVEWATAMAEGLAEAHRHGIIHRDIKPSNILLDGEGRAKIADFGLAKQVLAVGARSATDVSLTRDGVFLGTPSYMSPEQARGEEVGPRTDIFSFGCVLYELLTGRPPFERSSTVESLHAVIAEPPPTLTTRLPSRLAELVGRCLAKDPQERPAATQVLEDLRAVAATLGSLGEAPTFAGRVPGRRTISRHRRTSIAAGIILATAAVLLGWWWRSTEPVLSFSERDTILVGSIENETGDPALSRSLATALQISLEQSRYVGVLSPARVQQALRLMRRRPDEILSEALTREICQREGVRAFLTGSVSQAGGQYLLTLKIVDPTSGDPVRTLTERAGSRDTILPALDDLAGALRRALGESLPSIAASSRRLAEATTSSLDALQNFSEGRELLDRGRRDEAQTLFQRSIELDPDFARAYASLASTYKGYGITYDAEKAEQYFQEALKRLDRVSERERLEIQALYHGAMDRHQEAAKFYRLLIERHPNVDEYHFYVAQQYRALLRPADALPEYQEALRLNPRSSRTLVLIAICLVDLRQWDQAIPYYERAFAVDPEWEIDEIQNHQFGWSLIVAGQESRARATFEKMLAREGGRKARGHRSLAILALYHGRLEEARRQLEEASRTNEVAGGFLSAARDLVYLGEALVLVGRNAEAITALERSGVLLKKADYPAWLTLRLSVLYARMARTAEASRMLEVGRRRAGPDDATTQADLLRAEGELLIARKARGDGLEKLRRARAARPWIITESSLARALALAGLKDEAIATYEKLAAEVPSAWEGHLDWAIAHLELGRLYENAGDGARARRAYLKLSELWKDADADLKPAVDLRQALRRLAAA